MSEFFLVCERRIELKKKLALPLSLSLNHFLLPFLVFPSFPFSSFLPRQDGSRGGGLPRCVFTVVVVERRERRASQREKELEGERAKESKSKVDVFDRRPLPSVATSF